MQCEGVQTESLDALLSVAIQCVSSGPEERPTMHRVVQILESEVMTPCPSDFYDSSSDWNPSQKKNQNFLSFLILCLLSATALLHMIKWRKLRRRKRDSQSLPSYISIFIYSFFYCRLQKTTKCTLSISSSKSEATGLQQVGIFILQGFLFSTSVWAIHSPHPPPMGVLFFF